MKQLFTPGSVPIQKGWIDIRVLKTGEDVRDLVLRDSHELYSYLHSVCPELELIPQANGSVLGPISNPDKWPSSTAILFQYMTIEQIWTLDYNEPRKPKAGEEPRADYIYGNVLLQGPCDILTPTH